MFVCACVCVHMYDVSETQPTHMPTLQTRLWKNAHRIRPLAYLGVILPIDFTDVKISLFIREKGEVEQEEQVIAVSFFI